MASFDSSERGGTTDEFNRLLALNGLTDRPAGMPADPFTQPPAAAAPLPPPAPIAPAAPPEVPAQPAPRFPAIRTPASHGLAPLPPVVPNPPVVPWFKPRGTASKAEGGTLGTASAAAAAATGASADAAGAAGESDLPPIEEVVAGRARERATPAPVAAGPPPPGSSVPGEPSPGSSASGSITLDPLVPDPLVPDPVGGSAAPLPPEAPETPFTWFDRPAAGAGTPAGPPTVPPAAAFAPTPPTPAGPTTSMPAGALPTRPAAAPLPPPVRPVVPGATDRVVRSGAGWTGAGGAASTGPIPRLQGPPEQIDPAALPTTRAGLPMRVPAAGGTRSGGTGAEHIPGPAGRGSTPDRSGWEQPAPEVRPEWIRGRLSRLYEGVNHARGTDATDSRTADSHTTESRGLGGPGASPPVVPPGATRAERPFGSPPDRLEDE